MSYHNSNYYKGSAIPTRGGRGGSYRTQRGISDGGSTWQPRGRGRGNFSSGATRGSSTSWYNKSSSNFNKSYNDKTYNDKTYNDKPYNDKTYNDRNSSGNRDNNDRFSSRGNESDYSHRYSRQGNADNYSARNDHSHHRTQDDPPRKRMRTDSYSGDSNRRGHDSGFESYGSNRYDNYSSEKSNFGGSDDRARAVYRDDRRPTATRRDDFSQRPRETSATTMPPPAQSYRGTTFRGRGGTRGRGASRGGFIRRQDNFVSPRSRLVETFKAKKRLVVAKPDFFKSKLQKLRSFGVNRSVRKEPRPRDELEEENWDEVVDKDAENGEEKEKLPVKKKRPVKIVKRIIKKVVVKKEPKPAEETSATPEGAEKKEETKEQVKEEVERELEEGEEEEEIVEEEIEVEEEEELEDGKGSEKSESKVQVTIKRDSEGRAVSEDGSRKASEAGSSFNQRNYIKLVCPHCRTRCLTFKDYHDHLRSSKHVFSMREVSMSMKQTLMRMRTEQRAKQRVIEETEELQGISSAHTNFCPTCKLNYRQERERHVTSEMHKKMKDYLMPFCTVCHISFKSPMLYENHICSLEHIKSKENSRKIEREKGFIEDEKEKDVDLDDLLILDSVGSADEEESDEEADKEIPEGGKAKKKEKKHEINLGADYVRKVQVLYCDLCEMYLPRREQLDTALTSHCRTRNHLQRYVRYRDDIHLRREAERIHRRDQAEQEARSKALKDSESAGEKQPEKPEEEGEKEESAEKPEETKTPEASTEVKEVKKEPTTPKPKPASASQSENAEAAESEDKLWADVDKGLDELLREVAPGCKSSDEDEDSGRYDRFKHSKAEEAAAEADAAKKKAAEEEAKEPAAE